MLYTLTGKNEKGETVVLDDVLPEELAAKGAEYCGQYHPNYTDFVITPNGEADNGAC